MVKKVEMGSKSIVSRATTTSRSLRTTIPVKIVDEFGIKEGDVLDWEIRKINGKKTIIVRLLKPE